MKDDHINIRIEPELKRNIKVKIVEKRTNLTKLIVTLLEKWLKKG